MMSLKRRINEDHTGSGSVLSDTSPCRKKPQRQTMDLGRDGRDIAAGRHQCR